VQTTIKPSHRSAARAVPGLQRISGQRIVLGATHNECTVFGLRHRRAVEQRVSLDVALDLARSGVTTVVRVSEA
jgi:ribosomal protein L5